MTAATTTPPETTTTRRRAPATRSAPRAVPEPGTDGPVDTPDTPDTAGTGETPVEELTPGERLRRSGEKLLVAAIDLAAGKAVELVDTMADRLEGVAGDPSSLGMAAALGAGKAMMAGGNPVWGAIKGGWGALSTGKKVAIILVLVLLGLLSPVTLVLALVALLVVAIVKAVKN